MRIIKGHFKRWQIAGDHPEAEALAGKLGIHPLVGQVLCRRGLTDPQEAARFFKPKLTDLHDPALLPGCDRAARRLIHALNENEPIVIYGDYDVDGITASAILYHTLKTLKPQATPRLYVPHRIEEGYGLNSSAIEKLADEGAKVIITVDCGITALESARIALEKGVDLIITDHHEFQEELPGAHALVHPRIGHAANGEQGADYPFGHLCGAGVAYKLAWQLCRVWCGGERVSRNLSELLVNLLPLAALGTVADVSSLTGENRTLVQHGLKRVKHTPFVGLNALIDASNLRDEKIDAFHVGFRLGPRLNACGRLDHADQAVRLLTNADETEARKIASELNRHNMERQRQEKEIFAQALDRARAMGFDQPEVRGIVLAQEGWHAGVVGIVCSRLVEELGRPTILLSVNDGAAHGSGRSIPGFDLHEAITACSEGLTSFGGHAMAAGMKMPLEGVDRFRRAFIEYTSRKISIDDLAPLLILDGQAQLDHLSLDVHDHLEHLAPFGHSNPSPIFLLQNITVSQPRAIGAGGKHLSFFARQETQLVRCIAWGMGEMAAKIPAGSKVHLAAHLKRNEFRGEAKLELEVKDLAIAR